MAEYANASRSALKLKCDTISKTKKKKSKEAKKILEQVAKVDTTTDIEEPVTKKTERIPLTKAQKAFLKMKEKKQLERILEKASKTHKQRVEEFNRHLDSLTEHYDIPKVSWTK